MPQEHDKQTLKLAMRVDEVLKPFLKEETKHEAFIAVYHELVHVRKEQEKQKVGMAI